VRGIDAATLSRFVALAGDRLEGDWVVIGGCVLPLLDIAHRTTADIDVAGPEDAGMRQMNVLLEIAAEVGLPVAAINQAGAFFLHRIQGWADHLVPVHRGSRAAIHVPDATLFLLLKASRLTETDLLDCAKMIEWARKRRRPLDRERVVGAVRAAREAAPRGGRRERLGRLLRLLDAR
jgi:hypothetical protein